MKVVGQSFWYFISENKDLYPKMAENKDMFESQLAVAPAGVKRAFNEHPEVMTRLIGAFVEIGAMAMTRAADKKENANKEKQEGAREAGAATPPQVGGAAQIGKGGGVSESRTLASLVAAAE